MKNIQVIDGAENCAYDIFAATDEEFSLIFPEGENIAFAEDVAAKYEAAGESELLSDAFDKIWSRRIVKSECNGIHGTLFYQLGHKKIYYATRRDEEAANPDGTLLR